MPTDSAAALFSVEDLVALTYLGDSALLLAIGVGVTFWLWVVGARREACVWVLAALASATVIAVLKMISLTCHPDVAAFCPSGHVALTTQVYGSLAILGARGRSRWWQGGLLVATALVIGLVAWTRIALLAHSPLEVVTGLVVGGVGLGLFLTACRHQRPAVISLRALLVLLVVPVGLLYGTSLDATAGLRQVADLLSATPGLCQ